MLISTNTDRFFKNVLLPSSANICWTFPLEQILSTAGKTGVRDYYEQQPCEYLLGIMQNHPSPCQACVEEVPFRDVIDCPFFLVPHARSYPVAAPPIYRLL